MKPQKSKQPSMKIPTPKQLPSGSWHLRIKIDGKSHSITSPTEKACLAEYMALKAGTKKRSRQSAGSLTLTKAIDRYIERRQNILSPSTIAGYRRIQSQRFKTSMPLRISQVKPEQWQRIVNREARLVSPKTLKNAWCFVAGVLYEFTGERPKVTLPQKIDNSMGFLKPTEIQPFLDALAGDAALIPALLALSSLRQSEILGLRWDAVDLKQDVLYIRETAVRDEDGKLARKKATKNASSRRTVPIIKPLHDALAAADRRGDYVVTITEGTIRRHYQTAAARAGVPYVGAHGLRHSFASLACHLGLREETAMAIGGWADYHTMKKIYTHTTEEDLIADSTLLLNFFDPTKSATQKCNETKSA